MQPATGGWHRSCRRAGPGRQLRAEGQQPGHLAVTFTQTLTWAMLCILEPFRETRDLPPTSSSGRALGAEASPTARSPVAAWTPAARPPHPEGVDSQHQAGLGENGTARPSWPQ